MDTNKKNFKINVFFLLRAPTQFFLIMFYYYEDGIFETQIV